MTETITQSQFRDFKSYMRKMVRDIASAKTAPYINQPSFEEVAIVWNAGDKPKLEGYPKPENLTHIPHDPHLNHLEIGEYAFKRVVQLLMVEAGYKPGKDMFISGMKPGQFECNMYSSYEQVGEYDYASRVDVFFIRTNGGIDKAKKFFKALDDATLDRVCRNALNEFRIKIDAPKRRPKKFTLQP